MSVTIKDIAKQAGVSYSTVSKALRNSPLVKEDTKKKILSIAKELGYQPNVAARSLVSKKSWTVGVMWPTVERVAPSTLITKINEEFEKHSYTTLVSINKIDTAIETFHRFQVDAILVFYDRDDINIESFTQPLNIPILYYGIAGSAPFPTIDVNRKKAIRLAVDHLTELGHKNIAYIGDLAERDLFQIEKVKSFIESIQLRGIELRPDMIAQINGLESHDGYLAARNMLQKKQRPTAIISASYDLTRGILRAINEAGLNIPKDISIVSYDNIPQMKNLVVPVTIVGVELTDISNKITEVLLQMIESKEVPAAIYLEPELVVRNSSAPPKNVVSSRRG